jgi:type II secretory pathway predicted ATPase ExeA
VTRRIDKLRSIKPPYDPANPPAGTKLNLGVVASRLRVTITNMADASGVSRTAIANLLSNKWPASMPRGQLADCLEMLLHFHGATADEVRTLWHAQGRTAVNPDGTHKTTGPDARAPELPPHNPAAARAPQIEEDPPMLLPKQSLTPQARRHFKLFTNPFDGEVTSDDTMFVGDDIAYCREAMWQCAQAGGFMALVGESGAGKTTLQQDLEERLEHDSRSVIVMRPGVLGMEGNDTKGKAIKSADILHAVITRLDANTVVPQTLQARTVKAAKLLTSSAQVGNRHLLVVEEAHSMPDATLKHLKRLHEMRMGRQPLLGILLLAQPELKTVLSEGLRTGALREVAQRCEIVELLPLDGALKAYLERRAAAAGVALSGLMDDAAVDQVRARLTFTKHKAAISMCYPLAVNNLVTRALNAAAELGAPKVTKDVVASC